MIFKINNKNKKLNNKMFQKLRMPWIPTNKMFINTKMLGFKQKKKYLPTMTKVANKIMLIYNNNHQTISVFKNQLKVKTNSMMMHTKYPNKKAKIALYKKTLYKECKIKNC